MVLVLFDYVDIICYEQIISQRNGLLQNQEMRDQTSVKGRLLSHKLTPECIYY